MKEISKKILILVLISSLSVSIFGILEVIGYFIHNDLNYEDAIIPIQGYLNGIPIARMSPATGALFFTSGLSIIFFTIHKISLRYNTFNKLFVDIFGHLSLIISFTFCLSYLYGTPFFYESDNTIPMALTTAISFLFLSLAIIFIDVNGFITNLYKDTSTRNYIFKFIFPISTLSVIVSGLAIVFTAQSSIINPAFISATITILITIFVGLLSNHFSRYIGMKIDNSVIEEKRIIKESEEKFHAIFEQAGYSMILNPNTSDGIPIIIDANEAACMAHGYTREDFIGRPISDIDDEAGKLLIKKRTAEIMTGKQSYIENIHVRKDGTSFPVAIHAKRVNIGNKNSFIFTTEYDISELKQAESELKLSNDKFEKAFNYTPNMIVISNMKTGKIYDVNKTFLNKLGYKKDEVIGKTSFEIDLWYDLKDREKYLKLFEKDGFVEGDIYDFNTKNKNQITAKTYANIVTIDTKEFILAVAEDITELKNKDEMLINQSRQAAMGEMIGMIAHQWRQPISIISMDANNMLLDIAMDKFNETEAEKYANNITIQTKHLSKTIDDFRNFFKPDKVITKVNIREIFDQTLSIVKNSLKNNNIELKISYQTEREVYAYPRELMQVFVNIINNSKDALSFKNKENSIINIEVYEDKQYINTKICDNGGGIDADILSKVFDPYFSTKDEKTGTGLGLYMSKMIIEKHLNGVIEVCNSDEGACFTVRLLKEV
ncbi:PAS domain S-box protein [Sulfurimonas sp.]|uniref:PAS domain S-box protein n=1 Tax=Sulfurimonas sp. TaxID=2022749 RepID=UPI0035698967